jgi:signal transduction histidine kinase
MEADMAEIRVADEGRGMDKDDLNKIFEPFYTTKRDMGGTGLGLSVSIGIVSEHGGELLFASTPGEGTVCRIRLPLDSASVDIDEPSPTDMEPNP